MCPTAFRSGRGRKSPDESRPLRARGLLRSPSLARLRGLDSDRDCERGRDPKRRQADVQQPDACRAPGRRRPRTSSRTTSRTRPTGPTRWSMETTQRQARRGREREGRSRPRSSSLEQGAAVIKAVSPLSSKGSGRAQQGRADRLHLADASTSEPRRPDRGRGERDHRRRGTGRRRRPRGGDRRLPRAGGVQARRPSRARRSGSRRR